MTGRVEVDAAAAAAATVDEPERMGCMKSVAPVCRREA